MELWDLYDKNRKLTEHTMVRGDEMQPDTYHLVIHVAIFICGIFQQAAV